MALAAQDAQVAVLVPSMTTEEARACVAQISAHLNGARGALRRLHEAEGWRALGYDSWRACVVAEFGQSQRYLYYQLEAAQIERRIQDAGICTLVQNAPIPETHLRPLAAVPEAEQGRIYLAAVEAAPAGKLTAAAVVQAVKEYQEAAPAQPGRSTTPLDERDFWRTPPEVFAALDATYGPFTLDVAAHTENHMCDRWYGPGGVAEDALAVSWRQESGPVRAWCNPPYSRGMVDRFMRKAQEEARRGHASTTFLVFTWTDRPWWHDLVWDRAGRCFRPGVIVDFPEGRTRFLRPDGTLAGSPWDPSAIITFVGCEQGAI